MANRFKDPGMRREYDGAMLAYNTKHKNLFLPNGERRKSPDLGSSFATFFWGGYDGFTVGMFNFESKGDRNTIAYAHYRAGQDAAKQHRKP